VKRKELDRVITLYSNVLSDANPTEVVAEIKEVLKDYEIPAGYSFKFTGQQEDQAKEFAFLTTALMIAVFLIFLILVAQFNSASTPFIILTTVLLSLIGVLLGLQIFRMEFVIMMTMIGIISLAGIVVNNAIVLIDYTNLIMSRRKEELGLTGKQRLPIEEIKAAIVEGGKTRLRPVLLTAITTVLGLLPLATGMNIDFMTLLSENDPQIFFGGDNVIFWGPMSWTVIFGLTFATFLTLVIVPVMYYILNSIKNRLGIKAVK
jgi:multidrug efflux pump subunit AcrB